VLAALSLPRSPRRFRSFVAALAAFAPSVIGAVALSGCASVPAEAVTLSRTVGEDLQVVHTSYNKMVRDYFDLMRQETIGVFEQKFTPAYLKVYVPESGLVDLAKTENFEGLEFWARTVVDRLDSTRKQLVEPIDAREQAMLEQIDAMFARMATANAEVTAHLNSVRKVHEAQDQALAQVGLPNLRQQVTDSLTEASNFAKELTHKIESAEGKLEKLDLGK